MPTVSAIAETGTLMVCSRPGQERVASLLPPYHVAIVERRQIVPDLIDAFAMLQQEQMTDVQVPMTNEIRNPQSAIRNLPSNVTLITGPSKTGDIELQLTTGVHGPGKWRVIDPNGDEMLVEKGRAGAFGVAASSFPLDDRAQDGTWKAIWETGAARDEVTFDVRGSRGKCWDAIVSGEAAAMTATIPQPIMARAIGLPVLKDYAELHEPYQAGSIVTTRRFFRSIAKIVREPSCAHENA